MTRSFYLTAIFGIMIAANLACSKKHANWSTDSPEDPATLQVEKVCDQVAAYAGLDAALVKVIVCSDPTLNFKRPMSGYNALNYVDYIFIMPAQEPLRDPNDRKQDQSISEENWVKSVKRIRDEEYPYREITVSIGRISPRVSTRQKWEWDIRDMSVTSVAKKENKGIVVHSPKSFREIWDIALREGAPQNALATIEYDANGYTLHIYEEVELVSQYGSKKTKETVFFMRLDKDLKIIEKKTTGGDRHANK